MRISKTKFAATFIIAALTIGSAATADIKPKADTDGNGNLSLEEFVIFSAEKDMRQRDRNKDGAMSTDEWVGKSTKGYRNAAMSKFNKNGDAKMSTDEMVDVYSWTFGNRDKNKDGKLAGAEIPPHFKTK